jgi:4-alpha-glucanotransferase
VRRPALRALADRLGVLAFYVSQGGAVVRTSDATREALARAMGLDASTEAAAARALAALARAERRRLVAPVRVVRAPAAGRARLAVTLPPGAHGSLEWEVELAEEGGRVRRAAGRAARPPASGRLALPLPGVPGLGYHRLRVRLRGSRHERAGAQRLIVVPETCLTAAERLGRRRVFGLAVNLYSLRSARDWGVGDLGALGRLAAWAAGAGAAFVGTSPLHALRNEGGEISPYAPVSRLFRNPLYLDVEALPELADSAEARALAASPAYREALARLRASDRVDYDAVAALKRPLCALLHRAFAARHRDRPSARGRAYRRYLDAQGEALTDFATFCALEAHFRATAGAPPGWRRWPAAYRDPRGPAVAAFRATHAEAVDLHRWLQFALDRQLAAAARAGRRCGLALGIYQDLALGSAASGSDRWAFPDLFLDRVRLGAPPDDYAAEGQDWGLPAMDPRRLATGGYGFWTRLLRGAFAHAGALRIDHVLGLFRQYWIPAGRSAREGAYVRFPAEDLLGILALESRRAGALVVGEDLGTVPREVPRALARWGVLSSRVLYFERDRGGAFRAARRYPARALVTVNTHDLAPLAGWLAGRDLELRRAAGVLPDDRALAAARRTRAGERRALLRRLAAEGLLRGAAARAARHAAREPAGAPAATDRAAEAALRAAVHAFLCRTPAVLAGIALDDLIGETEPVNLPGVGLDRHPSWRRRLRLPLEALAADPGVRAALAGARARRRRGDA